MVPRNWRPPWCEARWYRWNWGVFEPQMVIFSEEKWWEFTYMTGWCLGFLCKYSSTMDHMGYGFWIESLGIGAEFQSHSIMGISPTYQPSFMRFLGPFWLRRGTKNSWVAVKPTRDQLGSISLHTYPYSRWLITTPNVYTHLYTSIHIYTHQCLHDPFTLWWTNMAMEKSPFLMTINGTFQ